MIKIVFCIIFLLGQMHSLSPVASCDDDEPLVVETEASYLMGDRDSRQDARELALYQAKRLALEKAGTTLVSKSQIENYELVKDEIISRAAGKLQTEIRN